MEKLKAAFELKCLPAIGEKSEVTDALKAGGQDMKQKAANELVGVQGHHVGGGVFFGAAIEKSDLAIGGGQDAAVGDGDTMRVAAQVFQHGFGG